MISFFFTITLAFAKTDAKNEAPPTFVETECALALAPLPHERHLVGAEAADWIRALPAPAKLKAEIVDDLLGPDVVTSVTTLSGAAIAPALNSLLKKISTADRLVAEERARRFGLFRSDLTYAVMCFIGAFDAVAGLKLGTGSWLGASLALSGTGVATYFGSRWITKAHYLDEPENPLEFSRGLTQMRDAARAYLRAPSGSQTHRTRYAVASGLLQTDVFLDARGPASPLPAPRVVDAIEKNRTWNNTPHMFRPAVEVIAEFILTHRPNEAPALTKVIRHRVVRP